jgi:histidine kinase
MKESFFEDDAIIQTSKAHYFNGLNEAGEKILIESSKDNSPSLDELLALRNDYEITRNLDCEGVLKSHELIIRPKGIAIVKDFFDGITLAQYLVENKLPIHHFLEIAIQLSHILSELHANKIIHKDINPENILISRDGKELKICYFGIATQLAQEIQGVRHNENLKGSLTHISPEQTGRMHRSIDYRSDLYSLGVIFYQSLCNKLPFEYSDVIELVHAHIARYPVEPCKLNKAIPAVLSDIVMKLLAKNAEDRFQSVKGLKLDLVACLKQWKTTGSISDIKIASEDFSSVLSISEKLYGRKDETELLVSCFEKIKNNNLELILVGGYSGIGKTRLINEIDKPVAASNGYFASGKFDQYNRDTPYRAVSQAFGSLIRQLLSENDESIYKWKSKISKALKGDGQILIDVIPELELLIGKQKPALKIGLSETNHRFIHLFQTFLHALSDEGNPLVIFIDDLQWTDSSSFDLLHKTLTNPILHNILILGAYRDNEVNASHPLMLFLNKLNNQASAKTHVITLKELDHDQVNQYIADTLRLHPENTHELTGLIMNKTHGNPFFIKQFIKKLAEDNLIYFDSNTSKWCWNSESISAMNVTENVVDLMVGKIQKLPDETKQTLQLASCIGSGFDIKTLSIVAEESETILANKLWDLVKEGFINPSNKWSKHAKDELWKELGVDDVDNVYDFFHFQHDRIQQAAYSLILEADRKKTHLKIGKLLLDKYKESNTQAYLFDMLKHLNFSQEFITKKEEKLFIAKLNLQAGDKAKRSNAYQTALIFFKAGMDLIEHQKENDLYNNLLLTRSETEYLGGNYQESEKLFDKALLNAQSNIEKATVLAAKMSLYENTNRQEEAIKIALDGLRCVGIILPEKPGSLSILSELMKAKYYLYNKNPEKLKENRNMDSPELLIAMKILVNLWGPAYLYNQNLLALAILKMVILSTRYGNCSESALAYAFYGFVISAQLKDYENGLQFAKLGIWLNEKFEDKTLRSKVNVIYAGCVAHWTVKYADLLDTLFKAHEEGKESNDLIYASYAFSFLGKTTFFMGGNLIENRNLIDKYIHFARQIMYPLNIHYMTALGRVHYDLTNAKPDETVFFEYTDTNIHLAQMKELAAKDGTYLFVTAHYLYQGMVMSHLGKYNEAIENFGIAKKTMESLLGLSDEIMYKFYFAHCLLLKEINEHKISFKEKWFVRTTISYFKKLATLNSDNFGTQYYILKAAWAQLNNNELEVPKFYEKALKIAKETGMTNFQSFANEQAARYYDRLKMSDLSKFYLSQAIAANNFWGAEAVNVQLKKEFPALNLTNKSKEQTQKANSILFVDTSSFALDLQSIFKASTTISGEIVFEKLVEKLLKIIVENAGAQKVFLILNDQGKLKAEAIANYEDEAVQLLNSKPLEQIENIAHSVVQMVFYTGETVIINDAATDTQFAKDEYFKQQKAKSVLCLPIKQIGKTIAILYLENNIASGAFTPARLELLNLLSGQIAISLENSLFYENLEQKVIDRTETIELQKNELKAEKEKSETLLLNILPVEVAEELKHTGSYKPRKIENVSIMFSDFEGFTKLSEKISTEELVEMIDYCYQGFDRITSKYNVEKIKTIGDSYMCVSGLPVETPDHALNAIKSAIEIRDFVDQFNKERASKNMPYCRIRIGIHSGSVAAGVVGNKKFAYDIWGDSVNIASRLESASDGGKINISSSTYELIKDHFKCTYRGKVQIKSKGEIDMYFVN